MSTIVTRYGKGSPLTWLEVDDNFTNLNTDKIQSGDTVAALTITSATINGGSINGTTVGASTASSGAFTTLSATGVTTVQAGTVSLPAITTTGDTNTGIFFPAADTIAFTEGGTEVMRINSSGNVGIGTTSPSTGLTINFNSSFTGTPGGINAGINIIGNTSCGLTLDAFAANGQITFRRANGTLASPSALLSGSILGAITWRGYGATGYSSSNRGLINLVAAENWTDTAQGTYFTFFTVASGTTSSTEKMRIESSGNVGLGTSSPGARLDVNGSATVSSQVNVSAIIGPHVTSDLLLGSVNGNTPFVASQGAYPLTFNTNATERMRIDSSGNVGIGTSSPGGKLAIATGGSTDIVAALGGTFPAYTYRNGSGAWFHAGKHPSSDYFYIGNGATPTTNISMVVDPSGNVGIGTSSPGARLHLSSTAAATGMRITDGTTLVVDFYANTSIATLNAVTAIPLAFGTNNTERMRIDSSGNVGIGNTGNANWKLLVSNGGLYNLTTGANGYFCVRGNNQTLPSSDNGTADTPNLAIGVNYSNGSAEVDYFNCNNAGDGHHFYQKTGAAAATRTMLLSGGGNLTISGATATKASGTTWANPSDIRLKDNVQDFAKGLTELLQVNVKTWEYNGKGGTVEGTKGIGVIADEIETILPETVDTYKAKLNADDEEDTDIKRFDATEITWLLVNSIQEQQTIINDLKARIETLEGK